MRDTSLYVVDGVRVPSVTEVLKIAGMTDDFSWIPKNVLEEARQRGEDAHEWLDMLDNGLVTEADCPDARIQGYVSAYLKFKAETGFDPMLIEHLVVNTTYRYAGTLDRCGTWDGDELPGLLDIKCVAQIPAATGPQTAGYELCLASSYNRFALQLKPDGSYRRKALTERNDRHDFLAALRVAHYKLRHGLAKLER